MRFAALAAGILGSVAGAAILVACAMDESAPISDPEQTVAPPDGGSDVNDASAEVDQEPCTPDTLCPTVAIDPSGPPLDVRTQIKVIRGRSADDVWAAGTRGVVLHFNGKWWSRSETGTNETMNALWLRDGGEVALSSRSSMYTRGMPIPDGGADASGPSSGGWTPADDPPVPTGLRGGSAWMTSSWAPATAEWLWSTTLEFPSFDARSNGFWRLRVSPEGGRLELGSAFVPGTCKVLGCRQLVSLHGASADDLWAVGFRGAIFHITSAQSDAPEIKGFDSRTWAGLNGVWVAAESDAWAVGGTGVIRHYRGDPIAWDVVSDVPTDATLRAVWGSSSTDIWAVGDGAEVLHYDGSTWSRVRVVGLRGERPDLYTVWTSEPGHVWVGGDGVLLSLGGE